MSSYKCFFILQHFKVLNHVCGFILSFPWFYGRCQTLFCLFGMRTNWNWISILFEASPLCASSLTRKPQLRALVSCSLVAPIIGQKTAWLFRSSPPPGSMGAVGECVEVIQEAAPTVARWERRNHWNQPEAPNTRLDRGLVDPDKSICHLWNLLWGNLECIKRNELKECTGLKVGRK